MKRHEAVHENINYVCPYCNKIVKRKPSIIKHLRLLHPDKKSTWNNSGFIANLKQTANNNANIVHVPSDQSMDDGSSIIDMDTIESNGTNASSFAGFTNAPTSATNFSCENSLHLMEDANCQMLDDSNDLYGLRLLHTNELGQDELYDSSNHLFQFQTIQT